MLGILVACHNQTEFDNITYKGIVVSYKEAEGSPRDYNRIENLVPLQGIEVERSFPRYSRPTSCCLASDVSIVGYTKDGTTFTDENGEFSFEHPEFKTYKFSAKHQKELFQEVYKKDTLQLCYSKSNIFFRFKTTVANEEVERDSLDLFLSHPIVGELPFDLARLIYIKSTNSYRIISMTHLNLELNYKYGSSAEYTVLPLYTIEEDQTLEDVFLNI